MDLNIHISFDKKQDDWVISRVWSLCKTYEADHGLFSVPTYDKQAAYMNFAREVAESVGFRSSGGEE